MAKTPIIKIWYSQCWREWQAAPRLALCQNLRAKQRHTPLLKVAAKRARAYGWALVKNNLWPAITREQLKTPKKILQSLLSLKASCVIFWVPVWVYRAA
jgi:hypothetical protein